MNLPTCGVVVSGAIIIQASFRVRFQSGEASAGLTYDVHEVDSKPRPLETKGSGTQSVHSGLRACHAPHS
jgi:hypothetical protein